MVFLFFQWCTVETAEVKAMKLYNILNESLEVKLQWDFYFPPTFPTALS